MLSTARKSVSAHRGRVTAKRWAARALVVALAAGALVLAGPSAAQAAQGDYSLELNGPAAPVTVGAAFSYNVVVTSSPTVNGAVLTAQLPAGVIFDDVPTGVGSPVLSASWDATTGEVTFIMKPLTDLISNFTFTVKQDKNTVKNLSTILTAVITGTQDGDPAIETDSADTTLKGDYDYIPIKSAASVVGGGNRQVTYGFNVQTEHAAEGTTFTTSAHEFIDQIAPGAVIVGQSSGWTIVGNTATWTGTQTYGPSSSRLDPSESAIWLTVSYPEAQFPDGFPPPANTVSLKVRSTDNVTWYGPRTTSVQGPELGSGSGPSPVAGITKVADVSTIPGFINNGYTVSGSYIAGDATVADKLVVTDSSLYKTNAAYFDHTDIDSLVFNFNQTAKAANLPYLVEYQVDGSATWLTVPGTFTTSTAQGIVVQRTGSAGWGDGATINLPIGTLLSGWRVTISPAAGDPVPSGFQTNVGVGFIATYEGFKTGSTSATALTNTATVEITPDTGAPIISEGSDTTVFEQGVFLTTHVEGPSTINVGDSANYQAGIVNQHPKDSYSDSQLTVVLPPGIIYNTAIGVSRASINLPPTSLVTPDIGAGVSVSTRFVTDPFTGKSQQVVEFTFADPIPPMRPVGLATDRWIENWGFVYNIPVIALPQAYNPLDETAKVRSYSHTDDPDVAGIGYRGWGGFFGGDTFDVDKNRTTVGAWSSTARINAAGGLMLGKLSGISPDTDAWSLSTVVPSPGTAAWQVYVSNVLPGPVNDAVIFDRLPYSGDANDSEFSTVLAGAVTGAPTNAVVEYSVDATTATSGTWTGTPVGAKAFRIAIPSIASGATFELVIPVSIPAGVVAGAVSSNVLLASGDYLNLPRAFGSNSAEMVVAPLPRISVVKTTNGLDVTGEPGPSVLVGSEVTWDYLVTNTGNTPLTGVTLDDDIEGTVAAPAGFSGNLAPGETVTFTKTGIAIEGLYENVGTVSADPVDGELVTDADPSWYTGVTADLSLVKTTNGKVYTAIPGATLEVGDLVTWGYTLTNEGDSIIDGIVLTDDQEGVISAPSGFDGTLDPGESVTYTRTSAATLGQYRNEAVATGATAGGTVDSNVAVSYYLATELSGNDDNPGDDPTDDPTDDDDPNNLASTGSNVAPMLGFAGLTLLLGFGMILFVRTRRRPRH